MSDPPFVSTGHLPGSSDVARLVDVAHERFRGERSGRPSDVYPVLARVAPELFGICVVGVDGRVHAAGDADAPFTIMSVSKPFVFALVCAALGPDAMLAQVGADATGLPFNSVEAVQRAPGGRTNPMVNAGAIATTALVPGAGESERWAFVLEGLSRFAGRSLEVVDEVYASASAANGHNRDIARLLHGLGGLSGDPEGIVDRYTRQCSLSVSARDLAVMGATLADGGVNPITGARVVDPATCHCTLAAMLTAGLYETSGTWLYEVGLPAKSGIGGGIVTVSPGKGGMGTFAPPLDAEGNSVRGRLATRFLSRQLGLDLLISQPSR